MFSNVISGISIKRYINERVNDWAIIHYCDKLTGNNFSDESMNDLVFCLHSTHFSGFDTNVINQPDAIRKHLDDLINQINESDDYDSYVIELSIECVRSAVDISVSLYTNVLKARSKFYSKYYF